GPYRHMHNMSLWTAEEDAFAMEGAFASQQLSLDIPMMDVVDFFHVDQMPAKRKRWMHHYRELLKRQTLLNGPQKIHLSKNPMMSGWVDSLIETFPGARIVVMMRNPEECIPSCLKLVLSSWRGKGWSKEECEVSLNILEGIAYETFHHPKAVLAQRTDTPHIVVDYRKLTSEPRETVLAVYEALGLEITEEFDTWLQQQAEREKKHHSKFEYSLGEFRLDKNDMHEKLAEFYEDFGWDAPDKPVDQAHDLEQADV
ncbi:MAG: sulfotransferase family protein, partial [Gammaproteobacteria bacterium]